MRSPFFVVAKRNAERHLQKKLFLTAGREARRCCNEIEKEQQEDSRRLKSYLEEKRIEAKAPSRVPLIQFHQSCFYEDWVDESTMKRLSSVTPTRSPTLNAACGLSRNIRAFGSLPAVGSVMACTDARVSDIVPS
jgi:hypothetical protein